MELSDFLQGKVLCEVIAAGGTDVDEAVFDEAGVDGFLCLGNCHRVCQHKLIGRVGPQGLYRRRRIDLSCRRRVQGSNL